MRLLLLLSLLCLGFGALAQPPQTRYITDQYQITLRSGAGTDYRIVRYLQSGTKIRVLSQDDETGWSRVLTEDGTEGYVLSRMLLEEPIARDRIAKLEEALAIYRQDPDQVANRFEQLSGAYDALQSEHRLLLDDNERLKAELTALQNASADIVSVTEHNELLGQRVGELEHQVGTLKQQNDDLESRKEERWFMIGAGVLLAGLLLGIIVPRLGVPRRRRSWNSL